eukprot:212803-Prymnesium_polylepis.1
MAAVRAPGDATRQLWCLTSGLNARALDETALTSAGQGCSVVPPPHHVDMAAVHTPHDTAR